jgi:hypothetical protein
MRTDTCVDDYTDVEETIKRTNRPYFVQDGNKTARMISVYRDQPIKAPELVEMFCRIIADNLRRKSVGPRR